MSKTPTHSFTLDRVLAFLSVGWLVVVLAVPFVQTLPLAVWVTIGLLTISFADCIVTLFRKKRILFLLLGTQIALFTVVPFQVFSALGAENYSSLEEPGLWDWLQYTGAHVLRAIDILDIIDEYRLDIQNVKHQSTLAGLLLVALHLAVDVFLLYWLARWLMMEWHGLVRLLSGSSAATSRVFKEQQAARNIGRALLGLQRIALVFCIIAVVGCAWTQGWSGLDWLLWPLDNLVRVVDVGDVMQIFRWRLHQVDMGFWTMTLAISFRFFIGLYLTRWLNRALLLLLGHRALQTLDEYQKHLKDDDAVVRRKAAESLGMIGSEAIPAVPALVDTLIDDNPEVRRAAKEALSRIDLDWAKSAGAQAGLPKLVEKVTEAYPRSYENTHPMKCFGDAAQTCVSQLIQIMKQDLRRGSAAVALGHIGPPAEPAIPSLIGALNSSLCRAEAAWALGRIGPPAQEAVPALIKALAVRDGPMNHALAIALTAIDDNWRPRAVTFFVEQLGDEYSVNQQAAAEMLPQIDPDWRQSEGARSAVPQLIEKLGNRSSFVKQSAIQALDQLGPPAATALTSLIVALADTNDDVRKAATAALNHIDADWRGNKASLNAVPRLAQKLGNDRDRAEQQFAAEVLGDLGSAAVPTLIGRLKNGPNETRRLAVKALGKIGPAAEIAVPLLIEAMDDPESQLKEAVATALGRIGPPARPAVASLAEVLGDSNLDVRKAATEALGRINPNWRESEEVRYSALTLAQRLGEGDPFTREGTTLGLVQMGPLAVAPVMEKLADTKYRVRESAAETLGQMGSGGRLALIKLVEALVDVESTVRVRAREALDKISTAWPSLPEARAAVPRLVEGLSHRHGDVREAAANALALVDPKSLLNTPRQR